MTWASVPNLNLQFVSAAPDSPGRGGSHPQQHQENPKQEIQELSQQQQQQQQQQNQSRPSDYDVERQRLQQMHCHDPHELQSALADLNRD